LGISSAVKNTLVVAWAVISVFAGAVLASFHQPFRIPQTSIVNLAAGAPAGSWRAIHILAVDCGCSQRVAKHLIERGALKGVYETVLIVKAETRSLDAGLLSRSGFQVKEVRDTEATAYGVTGVPLLTYVSPNGSRAYIGGYGAGGYEDVAIWKQVRSGLSPRPLPVLGCAVGRQLQRQIDPLSWKY